MDATRIDRIVARATHDDPDLNSPSTPAPKAKRKYTKRAAPTAIRVEGDREYSITLRIKIIPSVEAK